MRALVVGAGAVGSRAIRQLVEADDVDQVLVTDVDGARCAAVVENSGPKALEADDPRAGAPDAVLLAGPVGTHLAAARDHLAQGRTVVSTSDSVPEVRGLLDLDAEAKARRRAVVIGASFAPGYSCLLARHAASAFDEVHEIHVARGGTGGPACARHHHLALTGTALDWRDGGWQQRRAGSGRELCWFPDPVGAADCYRAELPDALVLAPAFPGVQRVTARLAATRRDRFSAHLPMLRRPHPEGLVGMVRVEVRGIRDGVSDALVFGALDRPAVAAGAVAARALRLAAAGGIEPGAAGLAAVADPVPFLHDLTTIGIKAAAFEGG